MARRSHASRHGGVVLADQPGGERHDPPRLALPHARELPSCQPVLFAYALDKPVQREALQEEILDRITAIQELCGTLSMAQLDDADPRCISGWPKR